MMNNVKQDELTEVETIKMLCTEMDLLSEKVKQLQAEQTSNIGRYQNIKSNGGKEKFTEKIEDAGLFSRITGRKAPQYIERYEPVSGDCIRNLEKSIQERSEEIFNINFELNSMRNELKIYQNIVLAQIKEKVIEEYSLGIEKFLNSVLQQIGSIEKKHQELLSRYAEEYGVDVSGALPNSKYYGDARKLLKKWLGGT